MGGKTYDQWKSRQKNKPKESTGTMPKSNANTAKDEDEKR